MKISAPRALFQILFVANIATAQTPVLQAAPVTLKPVTLKPVTFEPVTFETDATGNYVISNGLVRLGISQEGRLLELSHHGGPNLASAGYWNFNGNGYDDEGKMIPQRFGALNGVGTVVRQSDDLVELVFERQPVEPAFFKMSLHYVLRRGDSGFYLYMTAEHDKTMPAGSIVQYAYNLRLNPEHFNYIAVDDNRRHISHSPQAEKNSETIMDATFRFADGTVESKYNYTHAMEDGDFNLYGWAGPTTGVWWIQGSGEYYGSAPYRVLLTSHQTTTTPVLIWQAHCTHRGGYSIDFAPDNTSHWQKLYGPAFIYLNSGKDYDTLWEDAKTRVQTTQAEWPPQWMSHDYFALNRGEVSGTLNFNGNTPKTQGSPAAQAKIILAPQGTHWSQDNKGYHFWTQTDSEGRFNLTDVRPGTYTLYASGADQFYEYTQDSITVAPGKRTKLGQLTWNRVTHGSRIWQIGTADRSSGEFTNGDDFHHWGLWRRYPTEFPHDVHFVIGKSKEHEDWNFAHWNWYSQNNAWTIGFEMDQTPRGTATLTFGIAAAGGHHPRGFRSRGPADLRVWINGHEAGSFTSLTTGGDSYRSARQSTRFDVQEIRFDANLLQQGNNVISLRHALSHPYKAGEEKGERGSGPGCIMYDAIRLEIEE